MHVFTVFMKFECVCVYVCAHVFVYVCGGVGGGKRRGMAFKHNKFCRSFIGSLRRIAFLLCWGDFKIPPKNIQWKLNLANQHTLYSQCIKNRQFDYETATKQSKILV